MRYKYQQRLLLRRKFTYGLSGVILLSLLVGYWFLPFEGKILILTDTNQTYLGNWPQIKLEQTAVRPGDTVTLAVNDITAWNDVRLEIDAQPAQLIGSTTANGITTWRWRFIAPPASGYTAIFYRDCLSGCSEIARFNLGVRQAEATTIQPVPTKLGLVFADGNRDWHGRAGWNVELLYSQQPDGSDFGIDTVAQRVQKSLQRGQRVLIRLAYDQGQAVPPTNDEQALKRFLDYCARVARDNRLSGVYGYAIGSGFNRKSENAQAPDRVVTPEWYARLFNGYGLAPSRGDNVLQVIHSYNPRARVLVGAVTPWVSDQDGTLVNNPPAPWLNYMNTLVARLDESATNRQNAGIAGGVPDGFSVQAPGRIETGQIALSPAQEPATDIFQSQTSTAQMGFRIYRDWLAIINRYATTRNLPVYITSTNTFTSDAQIEPYQNYPVGWLTTALAEVNRETQIQALCWFSDYPYDKWAGFSLKAQLGHLSEAAKEFDQLLKL